MKKLPMAILTALLILAGCATLRDPPDFITNPPAITTQTQEKKLSKWSENTMKILDALQAGEKITEIQNPNLSLPTKINEKQILKYFSLGNLKLALALKPSMNVALTEIPKTFSPTFAGILTAEKEDSTWTPLLEISDANANKSSKNNPYYLWSEGNQLMVSIVDQNGAGSGEGIMKLLVVSPEINWKLNSCYYYEGNPGTIQEGTTQEGSSQQASNDYFSYTANLSKQKSKPFVDCRNDVILSIKS